MKAWNICSFFLMPIPLFLLWKLCAPWCTRLADISITLTLHLSIFCLENNHLAHDVDLNSWMSILEKCKLMDFNVSPENQILNVLYRSATSLRNVNAASSDSSSNSSDLSNGLSNGEKDNRIDCDVKTLRLYSIHQVRNAFQISFLMYIHTKIIRFLQNAEKFKRKWKSRPLQVGYRWSLPKFWTINDIRNFMIESFEFLRIKSKASPKMFT